MRRKNKNEYFDRNKSVLLLNLVKALPKIGYRFCHYLITKKKLKCIDFRPTYVYCISDTVNQLVWKVEYPIFLLISNSSKVYFDSGELIFKVNSDTTGFSLTAFGTGRKKHLKTSIQVVSLNQHKFGNLYIQSKSVSSEVISVKLKGKNRPIFPKQRSIPEKNLSPRKVNFPKFQFKNQDALQQDCRRIADTTTINELDALKKQYFNEDQTKSNL